MMQPLPSPRCAAADVDHPARDEMTGHLRRRSGRITTERGHGAAGGVRCLLGDGRDADARHLEDCPGVRRAASVIGIRRATLRRRLRLPADRTPITTRMKTMTATAPNDFPPCAIGPPSGDACMNDLRTAHLQPKR
jgi:hypothetical protein